MYNVLTGHEFNSQHPNIEFYKLTNKEELHNNINFIDGLNIDPIKFNPFGSCLPGGIYFTEYNKIAMWLSYSGKTMYWIRKVKIPSDAKVYVEVDKFKTDKIYLESRVPLSEFKAWENHSFCLCAVKTNGLSLIYIHPRFKTEELCINAIKQNWKAFIYVCFESQTEEICALAVQQNSLALEYVHPKFKTDELCALVAQ